MHSASRITTALPLAAASLGLLALGAPASNAQNLLTNGSFEAGNFTGANPNGVSHLTQLNPSATNITGWTVLSGNNVSDIVWVENGNPYTGNASDGIRSLDLTGFRDTTPYGGVTQTLTLSPGTFYNLKFDLGSYESTFTFRGPVSARATIGSLDQTFTFTAAPGSTGQQWGNMTANFSVTSVSNTLQISGVSAAGAQYLGLDNASITAVSAASAPEPGSVALLFTGVLPLAGLVARRRAAKATTC